MRSRRKPDAPAVAEPFEPNPELLALFPERSGNAINGLGEHDFRRPEPLYWHDPATIEFGAVQQYFAKRSDGPLINAAREKRQSETDKPIDPVAPSRADHTGAVWSQLIKDKARALGADAVGIARFNPDWVFAGRTLDHQWMVVLGVAHDYDEIAQAPGEAAGAEVIRQYGRGTHVAKALANWIRGQGHAAHPHSGPGAGSFVMIPAAIEAGLGELGKHGSIINRRLGSSFRLAAVLLDLPLVADTPDTFGADDFCTRCQACAKACPPQAIADQKQWVRGAEKWYVDFDKCITYFNETMGCAICLAVCPWSIPGVADNLLQKLARRRP